MNIEEILRQHKIYLETDGEDGTEADFHGRDISNLDLRGKDLRNIDFTHTIARNTDFRATDLRGANFRDAVLDGADFRDADVRYTILPVNTWFIIGEPYFIFIHNNHVRCECAALTVESWRSMTRRELLEMNGKDAVNFHPRLLKIIDFYCSENE